MNWLSYDEHAKPHTCYKSWRMIVLTSLMNQIGSTLIKLAMTKLVYQSEVNLVQQRRLESREKWSKTSNLILWMLIAQRILARMEVPRHSKIKKTNQRIKLTWMIWRNLKDTALNARLKLLHQSNVVHSCSDDWCMSSSVQLLIPLILTILSW